MPPTATETLTSENQPSNFTKLSLKASSLTAPSPDSASTTLRSLYPRTVKAFLKQDVALTYTLLTSAFSFINSPSTAEEDELSEHRLKWDLLRITLETTVYSSPPLSEDPAAFPTSLRANKMLSPQSLVNNLYSRSLRLFTPQYPPQKPNAAYLPPKILVTLIPASMKLGCPDVGRGMIEEWLARRPQDGSLEGREYYWKVLNYYCLEILPRLEEWDYAGEFLQYERELDPSLRNDMTQVLRSLQQQHMEARNAASAHAKVEPTRSSSPTPSTSSDSSSHTATPRSPNPYKLRDKDHGKPRTKNGTANGISRMTPSPSPSLSSTSSSSLSVASATTSRTVTPASVNRSRSRVPRGHSRSHENGSISHNEIRSDRSASSSLSPVRRDAVSPPVLRAPSTLALIRSYIQNLVHTASKSRLAAFILLFVVFPMASFVFRARRRRIAGGSSQSGAADEVRRRLRAAQGGVSGSTLLGKFWEETLRVVGDTVMMGGRGLV